jgi:hypothetical protein
MCRGKFRDMSHCIDPSQWQNSPAYLRYSSVPFHTGRAWARSDSSEGSMHIVKCPSAARRRQFHSAIQTQRTHAPLFITFRAATQPRYLEISYNANNTRIDQLGPINRALRIPHTLLAQTPQYRMSNDVHQTNPSIVFETCFIRERFVGQQ